MSIRRVAQIVGITGSLALSGSIFTYSYAAIPAISLALSTPSLACQQWKRMYSLGKAISPPLALISAGSFWWVWMSTGEVAYIVATGLAVSIVPWALIVMKRTNDSVATFDGHTNDGGVEAIAVKKLLDRWALMNFIRALFPFVGGIVGLVAALP
ncbi:hypothetical protein L208DRAFT_1439257, partial [Tricholoma matsutake]